MGSGSGSNHSGTGGGSQPYAESYHVVSKEMNKDKKDPDIYSKESGYFKNPTATNLESSLSDDRFHIDGGKAHGTYTYVMDKKREYRFRKARQPE